MDRVSNSEIESGLQAVNKEVEGTTKEKKRNNISLRAQNSSRKAKVYINNPYYTKYPS